MHGYQHVHVHVHDGDLLTRTIGSARCTALCRVYPQRVAGTPTGWSWDRTAHVFTLSFDEATGVTGATEIFVPSERFFASGYRVESSDANRTWMQSWDATRHVLSITSDHTTHSHTITIRPM